jgi:hypothetical protein
MNELRSQISEGHEGTFEWIFSKHSPHDDQMERWDCFPCWLESKDAKLYWINGKAGSGKSTLVKFLISDSRTKEHLEAQNGEILILSHFLWKAGLLTQKSIKGILLNLLHQLLSKSEMVLDMVMSQLGKKYCPRLSRRLVQGRSGIRHPLRIFSCHTPNMHLFGRS